MLSRTEVLYLPSLFTVGEYKVIYPGICHKIYFAHWSLPTLNNLSLAGLWSCSVCFIY